MRKKQLEQIIEAALFSSPNAVSLKQIASVIGEPVENQKIREAIEHLNQVYEKTGRVFRVHNIAGGFQIRTQNNYREWVQKLETIKPTRLSLATVETLAIVAYKQPITRAAIEAVRGVDSSYTLRTLMEKRLIRVLGKEQVPGRPSLYGTSASFLEVFGLKDLKSLPELAELESEPEPQLSLNLEEDSSPESSASTLSEQSPQEAPKHVTNSETSEQKPSQEGTPALKPSELLAPSLEEEPA